MWRAVLCRRWANTEGRVRGVQRTLGWQKRCMVFPELLRPWFQTLQVFATLGFLHDPSVLPTNSQYCLHQLQSVFCYFQPKELLPRPSQFTDENTKSREATSPGLHTGEWQSSGCSSGLQTSSLPFLPFQAITANLLNRPREVLKPCCYFFTATF